MSGEKKKRTFTFICLKQGEMDPIKINKKKYFFLVNRKKIPSQKKTIKKNINYFFCQQIINKEMNVL